MEIIADKAPLADCKQVYPLICELASGGWTGAGGDYTPDFNVYAATFERLINDESKGYYIAKEGETIVGLVGVELHQSLVEAGNYAYIVELVVDNRYRKHGVGQKLVEAAETFAKAHCCQSVVLTTGTERFDAHRLYERNGFMRIGVKYAKEY